MFFTYKDFSIGYMFIYHLIEIRGSVNLRNIHKIFKNGKYIYVENSDNIKFS